MGWHSSHERATRRVASGERGGGGGGGVAAARYAILCVTWHKRVEMRPRHMRHLLASHCALVVVSELESRLTARTHRYKPAHPNRIFSSAPASQPAYLRVLHCIPPSSVPEPCLSSLRTILPCDRWAQPHGGARESQRSV